MRLIYMGTPDFAVKPLELLYASRHEILAVATSPDKQRGRGRIISPTAVKKAALKLELPILQPTNLKSDIFIAELKKYNPDLIVVVAFRILPEIVFSLPRYGSINLHASLLPRYRGAAPINWALINGETKTGLTTFFLNKKIDTGDILLQREVEISPDDDFGSLHDKMMEEGARLILETIDGIDNNSLKPQQQSNMEASSAPKLTRNTGLIDWNWPADRILNLIRGLSPHPGAFCFSDGKKMIILKAAIVNINTDNIPGLVIESNPRKGFTLACGQDALYIKELKPQGKKVMGSAEFVRGYHVKVGDEFSA